MTTVHGDPYQLTTYCNWNETKVRTRIKTSIFSSRVRCNHYPETAKLTSLLDCDDLRNVFKTILGIPSGYTKKIRIVLNCKDSHSAWRILIILLLMLIDRDEQRAAARTVHLWYSAFISWGLELDLRMHVMPVIRHVLENKLQDDTSDFVRPVKFVYNKKVHLWVHLEKFSWMDLFRQLRKKSSNLAHARICRFKGCYHLSRGDWRVMDGIRHRPIRRLGKEVYRRDGVLLPFGASRSGFVFKNRYV